MDMNEMRKINRDHAFGVDITKFKQAESTDFNYRKSLTPNQKNLLENDTDSLLTVVPYLAALIRENGMEIQLSAEAISTIESSSRFPSAGMLTGLTSMFQHIDGYRGYLSESMHTAVQAERERILQITSVDDIVFRINPLLPTGTHAVLSPTHQPIQRDESQGYPNENLSPLMTAVDYLMVMDLETILFHPVGRGKSTPRFLPYYPTRTIVKRLVQKYSSPIRLCSILALDGVDYSTFTRDQFAEQIKRIHGK